MRRGLSLLALATMLAGLELSTEVVSLFLSRFGAGVQAIVAGVEFHVAPTRFVVGLLSLFVGLALWGLLMWSGQAKSAVNSIGGMCPDCGNKTRRVKRKESQRILAMVLGQRLTRRKCEVCGWHGLSEDG